MPSIRRSFLVAAIASACVPASASAALVEYRATDSAPIERFLEYTASKGERNRVTVLSTSRTVTFVDPGARMRIKKGDDRVCALRGPHRAVCRRKPTIPIDLILRDGDDRAKFTGRQLRTRLGRTARTEARTAGDLADEYSTEFDGPGLGYRGYVSGGTGDDIISGTRGDDILLPGSGRNRVDGGAGEDTIWAAPTGGADLLRGGRGIDMIDLYTRRPTTVDMAAQTVTVSGRTDSFESVERAHGGFGNDTLRGSAGADGLFGDDGADRIEGLGGNDYVGGDYRASDAEAEAGVDILDGGPGDDVIDGRDDLDVRGIPEQLLCREGNDMIVTTYHDYADPSCERSAFGIFYGSVDDQRLSFDGLSSVQPVGRAPDGAPIYSIACPSKGRGPCRGYVWLAIPPKRLSDEEPIELGQTQFTIPLGGRQNVTVVLNATGKAVLARPRPDVGVMVDMGQSSVVGNGGGAELSPEADFGWRQTLSP